MGGFSFVLVKGVRNMDGVIGKLKKGELDCGVIDPAYLISVFHLIVAAEVAVDALGREKLKTSNINSEILFALSPSRTISQAYATFGPKSDSKALVFGAYSESPPAEALAHLTTYVHSIAEGEMCPISSLTDFTDSDRVKKLYKVKDEELRVGTLEDAIVCKISTQRL